MCNISWSDIHGSDDDRVIGLIAVQFKRVEGLGNIVNEALHLLFTLKSNIHLRTACPALVFIIAGEERMVPKAIPQCLDVGFMSP
jgi:hypothetical protein